MPGFYIARYACALLLAVLFTVWHIFPPYSSADTYADFAEVTTTSSIVAEHTGQDHMLQAGSSIVLTIFSSEIAVLDNIEIDAKAAEIDLLRQVSESVFAEEESQPVPSELELPKLVVQSPVHDARIEESVIVHAEVANLSLVPSDPFFEAFNETLQRIRQTHNLQSLVFHTELSDLAKKRSIDMAKRDYFSHTNPDGCGIRCQFQNAAIPAIKWAENIGWYEPYTYLTKPALAREFLKLWMESSGHRENILDSSMTHYGIGTALQGDKMIITMLFARME